MSDKWHDICQILLTAKFNFKNKLMLRGESVVGGGANIFFWFEATKTKEPAGWRGLFFSALLLLLTDRNAGEDNQQSNRHDLDHDKRKQRHENLP
ncbi:hypothetical protein SAMN04515695_5855 [Pseudovibrio sp. Tun.PSC04-5.I4]|nr:hypothetical protein SAMN04515695_5855 [Pseudovibrio sp. Tun.PSC04-5.I4]